MGVFRNQRRLGHRHSCMAIPDKRKETTSEPIGTLVQLWELILIWIINGVGFNFEWVFSIGIVTFQQ